MTGLKNIENQRAFEKAQLEAKEEPAYQLLEELFNDGYIHTPAGKPFGSGNRLRERVRVYLATGTLLPK